MLYLGSFAKLQRATMSFVISVRLSVHPQGTTLFLFDRFSLNLTFHLGFLESVEKIQSSLKCDRINASFRRRQMYLYGSICLNCFENENSLSCRENGNIFYI